MAKPPHDLLREPPAAPPAATDRAGEEAADGAGGREAATRLPLSVLVDQIAQIDAGLTAPSVRTHGDEAPEGADGPEGVRRDQHFVRALAATLDARSAHLRLEVVDALGLEDVVATFHMRRTVRLVVTGYPPAPHPGSVTLTIEEADFPHTTALVTQTPSPKPYEFCTLDYALAGRTVTVLAGPLAGHRGTILASATVGTRQDNRVRLDDGRVVSLPGDSLELTEP